MRRICTYSRFHDVCRTDRAPGDVARISLTEDRDGFSGNPELAVLGLYAFLETSVDGVVLEHVHLDNALIVNTISCRWLIQTDHVFQIDEGAVIELSGRSDK